MNDIDKLFFELIQVSIGNRVCLSHTPSADEWGKLYALAKKQSLVGICFAGVQYLITNHPSLIANLSESLHLQWMGMAAKIQQRNEVVNRQCVELQKRLAEAGMRSSILKGQGVALCYDESLRGLRQSGDIDVYVDCGRERAIEFARGIQKGVDWDYKHLHLKAFPDTEVELHYVPEVLLNLRKNRKLQRWFKSPNVQESMFHSSGNMTVPSVEFNLFYILLHIYRHFFFEGVGLRQLMDYYFVLRTQISDERLVINDDMLGLLEEFGMMRFAKGVMWIMQSVFGGLASLNLGIETDEKEGRYILREVMEGGNFGHHDERQNIRMDGKVGSVVKIMRHNLHLLAHYPSEGLWAPVYFVWHYFWKKINDK